MQRTQYQIEVELLSEAIFSSGEKESNLVHTKVLTDTDGFVYFHAKSLKGLLKKRAYWLFKHYAKIDHKFAVDFLQALIKIFGINNEEIELLAKECESLIGSDSSLLKDIYQLKKRHKLAGALKLAHLELPQLVRSYYKQIYNSQFSDDGNENSYVFMSKHNLIEAQTHVRVGIQLEDGIIKNKMLNSVHTVRQGLIFYAPLIFEHELSKDEINNFSRIVYALDRIGAVYHRGYGQVRTKLLYKMGNNNQQEKGEEWSEVLPSY